MYIYVCVCIYVCMCMYACIYIRVCIIYPNLLFFYHYLGVKEVKQSLDATMCERHTGINHPQSSPDAKYYSDLNVVSLGYQLRGQLWVPGAAYPNLLQSGQICQP